MLKIRREQFEALKQTEEEFVGWIVSQIRQEHGEIIADLPDEKVKLLVECSLQRAREAYQFTHRPLLAAYVMTMFVCAPNFDEYAPIQKILTDAEIDEQQKYSALIENTTEEDRIAARRDYDKRAWFAYPRNIALDESSKEESAQDKTEA